MPSPLRIMSVTLGTVVRPLHRIFRNRWSVAMALGLSVATIEAAPFTYQGRLVDNATPANGCMNCASDSGMRSRPVPRLDPT